MFWKQGFWKVFKNRDFEKFLKTGIITVLKQADPAGRSAPVLQRLQGSQPAGLTLH